MQAHGQRLKPPMKKIRKGSARVSSGRAESRHRGVRPLWSRKKEGGRRLDLGAADAKSGEEAINALSAKKGGRGGGPHQKSRILTDHP